MEFNHLTLEPVAETDQPTDLMIEEDMSPTSTATSTTPTTLTAPTPTSQTGSSLTIIQRVLDELHSTERFYLTQIDILLQQYLQPLNDKKLASQLGLNADSKQVWSKCLGALAPVVQLHRDMEIDFRSFTSSFATDPVTPSSTELITRLSSLFLKHSPYLKMYTAYVDSYAACLAFSTSTQLTSKWKKWVEDQNMANGGGQNLNSLLIMPIQRIPRYELLLNKIDEEYTKELAQVAKNADINDNADTATAATNALASLQQARTVIHALNIRINEWKRESESKQKLSELSQQIKNLPPNYYILESHRRYIGDIVVGQIYPNPNEHKELHLWLTNDVLMLVSKEKCKLKGWISLGDIVTILSHGDMPDDDDPYSKHLRPATSPDLCLSIESSQTGVTFVPQVTKRFTTRLSMAFGKEASVPFLSPTRSNSQSSVTTPTAANANQVNLVIFEFDDVNEKNRWNGLLSKAVEAFAASKESSGLKTPTHNGLLSPICATSPRLMLSPAMLSIPECEDQPNKKQRLSATEAKNLNTISEELERAYSPRVSANRSSRKRTSNQHTPSRETTGEEDEPKSAVDAAMEEETQPMVDVEQEGTSSSVMQPISIDLALTADEANDTIQTPQLVQPTATAPTEAVKSNPVAPLDADDPQGAMRRLTTVFGSAAMSAYMRNYKGKKPIITVDTELTPVSELGAQFLSPVTIEIETQPEECQDILPPTNEIMFENLESPFINISDEKVVPVAASPSSASNSNAPIFPSPTAASKRPTHNRTRSIVLKSSSSSVSLTSRQHTRTPSKGSVLGGITPTAAATTPKPVHSPTAASMTRNYASPTVASMAKKNNSVAAVTTLVTPIRPQTATSASRRKTIAPQPKSTQKKKQVAPVVVTEEALPEVGHVNVKAMVASLEQSFAPMESMTFDSIDAPILFSPSSCGNVTFRGEVTITPPTSAILPITVTSPLKSITNLVAVVSPSRTTQSASIRTALTPAKSYHHRRNVTPLISPTNKFALSKDVDTSMTGLDESTTGEMAVGKENIQINV